VAGSLRFARHQLRLWRRTWYSSAFSTFVAPALYLASIGLGLGTLVDDEAAAAALGGATYAAFAGTGLMAASAMQTGAGEMSWPVMGAIRYTRTWLAAVATPLRPADLLGGKLVVLVLRLAVTSAVFAVALAALGIVEPLQAAAAVPPSILTGVAFGTILFAVAAGAERDFTIGYVFRFAITPLFIVSGTFFPISQLPAAARPLAALSPLWHGLELVRAAALGAAPTLPAAVHVLVLLAWAVGGAVLSVRLLTRRLQP
jgi:lipooligosaccharide transport system permease protein